MRRKGQGESGSNDCLYMARNCGFWWLLWWCSVAFSGSGGAAPHSRVRLVDTVVVVVWGHRATARHHHVVGIEFRIEGVSATAADHHVIRIHLHIVIVRRRLRRRRRRRSGRGRSVVAHQVAFNLHVPGQNQLWQIRFQFLNTEDCDRSFIVVGLRVLSSS